MIFLKFIWNDNELFWKINNGKLQKGKIENKKENYDLSLKEGKVLDEVFSLIFDFSKTTKLKTIYFNNKSIAHFINESGFNFFYEEQDNKLILLNEKDLKILNYIYNNQNGVWAFQLNDLGNKNYFKRIVNVGKTALVVFLISSITLGLNNNIVVKAQAGDYEAFYQSNIAITEEVAEEQENVILTYNDIVNLVNENPYLKQEEKNLILDCQQYFFDNLKYMNNAHVQKMLKNLRIEYTPIKQKTINGTYYDNEYKIVIYNSDEFSNAPKNIITHEISHAFAIPPLSYAKMKNGQITIEALNTIVNNEYYGESQNYDNSYNSIIPYVRILCEIVDPEILKQAFFKTDISLIKDYLLTIINDENLIENLFTTVDVNFNLENEVFLSNDVDNQNILNLINENNKVIYDSLKLIYETKTQDSITNNEEIMFWVDKNKILEDKINSYYTNEYLQEIALYNYTNVKENKTYFVDKYPNSIINLCTQIKADFFPLTEEDIQEFIQNGIIKKENGSYLISNEYQNHLIIKDNQVYQIGYSPSEYSEYKLQNNTLNYQK